MIWDSGDIKRRIIDDLDFKAFESTKRTLTGIEIVQMISSEQLISNRISMYKLFFSATYSLN